jgi:hypothetical protein
MEAYAPDGILIQCSKKKPQASKEMYLCGEKGANFADLVQTDQEGNLKIGSISWDDFHEVNQHL